MWRVSHHNSGMSNEDFDLDSLAAFLHLTPQQVARMADRGKVPGRKVSGQWKFSRAEIHHWFEERIGVSDTEELVEVEQTLRRQRPVGETYASLADMLRVEAVEPLLNARSPRAVIESICDLAAQTGQLWDPPKMAEAVKAREELHPTALEGGVALLHPRRPMPQILGEPILALAKTGGGIPFGGSGGALTDIFFLIASVSERQHLHTLARLSRLLTEPDFISQLRAADSPGQLVSIVAATEQGMFDA